MDRKRVGIVLFNEIEVLDFCGRSGLFRGAAQRGEAARGPALEVLLLAARMIPSPPRGDEGRARRHLGTCRNWISLWRRADGYPVMLHWL